MIRTSLCYSTLGVLLLNSSYVLADGLTDLKSVLQTLNGDTPISATVESSFTEKRGKKRKSLKTKTGLIQVALNDNHEGLELIFSDEIIDKLDNESNLKQQNEDANTPTLNAVGGVGVAEMKRMLSAAPSLLRFIDKAIYLNEETVSYHDKNMRQLNFSLPLHAIIENKEVHEYVDDFSGDFHVIINENGVPLESRIKFEGSGSAYIFFTMDISQSDTSTYQLFDDRLVKVKKVFEREQRSTWGKTSAEGYKVLIINPPHPSLAATN
ncbi:hypothetical protein [Thalassotalea sp. G2M2-11]|uniref:hypothetical protein n=1 Tax=Thalassotalea sp. G2M2-11 TaxID=2787627 RepID=UPI0019CFFDE4|nr:hypothetical protein [Thalassotalea sp. G2M2-11]